MRRIKKPAAALLAVLLAPAAFAESIIGIRESRLDLVSFDSATPATLTGQLTLSGFPAGAIPIAVDYRPGDGLYLLATLASATTCQLFTVNATSGVVTAAGSSFTCNNPPTDIDFDPSLNELRIVTSIENYTYTPGGGRHSWTSASYSSGSGTPDIIGTAFDNNLAAAVNTTLYGIDSASDSLVMIGGVNGSPSPDGGVITPIGALGAGITYPSAASYGAAPFDISGATGTAYLFRYASGVSDTGQLYTVNLSTGAATPVGHVASGDINLLGMAVAPGVTLPPIAPPAQPSGGAAGAGLLLLLGGLGLWRRGQR